VGKSKFEIVVILVSADPKPIVIPISFASDSAVTAADFNSMNAAFLFEAQRGMSWVCFKKREILVSEYLDVLGKLMITFPERFERV